MPHIALKSALLAKLSKQRYRMRSLTRQSWQTLEMNTQHRGKQGFFFFARELFALRVPLSFCRAFEWKRKSIIDPCVRYYL